MNRRLHRLASLVLLAISSAHAAAANNGLGDELYPSAAALVRDKPYCIDKICLGATIAEVRPMGVLYWQDGKLPVPDWKCSLGQNTAAAHLLLRDGRRVRLTFSKVRPEGGEEQYRLTTLGMPMPDQLSSTQVRYAVKEVADRWKLPEGRPGVSWIGKTPENLMTVMLAISSVTPFGSAAPFTEIAAIAMLNDEEKWMMSLPQCRAGLPKL